MTEKSICVNGASSWGPYQQQQQRINRTWKFPRKTREKMRWQSPSSGKAAVGCQKKMKKLMKIRCMRKMLEINLMKRNIFLSISVSSRETRGKTQNEITYGVYSKVSQSSSKIPACCIIFRPFVSAAFSSLTHILQFAQLDVFL